MQVMTCIACCIASPLTPSRRVSSIEVIFLDSLAFIVLPTAPILSDTHQRDPTESSKDHPTAPPRSYRVLKAESLKDPTYCPAPLARRRRRRRWWWLLAEEEEARRTRSARGKSCKSKSCADASTGSPCLAAVSQAWEVSP